MTEDLRKFWDRFQTGIEVAVGSQEAHKLLGTRDGFLRYFHDGFQQPVSIVLVPHGEVELKASLPMSDEEALEAARQEARALEEKLGDCYHFYVGNEGCLHFLSVDGEERYFVRSWTVIRSLVGEAWGGSGSVQLPLEMVERLAHDRRSLVRRGRRRSGGMIASVTGGLETRRSAVANATLYALSSLFYEMLESRPGFASPRR